MGKRMEIVLDPNGACELPNFVCNIQPIESPYSFVHPHDLSQYQKKEVGLLGMIKIDSM